MNVDKIFLIFILFFVLFINISFVVAQDVDNNDLTYNSQEISINGLYETESSDNTLNNDCKISLNKSENISSSHDEEVLSSGKSIVVNPVNDKNNEMNNPTIQTAINNAKDGDTIIINGKNYEHCHIIIDRKLTIISNVGTIMTPCYSNSISEHQGIFYITPEASGTVIEGFNLKDNAMFTDVEGYGIFSNGASNIIIRNCNITTDFAAESVRIENGNDILIQNLNIFSSINGIKIKNSKKVTISNSFIYNNEVGILIGEESSQINIISNNLTNNQHSGVSLLSSDYMNILNNYIAFNNKYGVYVNCDIIKIEIKGNFFNQNKNYEVFNDVGVTNLFINYVGQDDIEIIDNNYMMGGADRPVKTITSGGGQSGSYMRYVFAIGEYLNCPSIYSFGNERWYEGNYLLRLSEISQIRKGVYSISIIDAEGNIAKDLSSVPVTFYLNKNNSNSNPQEGDVYKTVMMKNGTATVRFYAEDFNESGNILLASFPGLNKFNIYSDENPYKQLTIEDEQIPGVILNTKIQVSNLNTFPVSGEYLIATLKDSNNVPISGKDLIFNINSKNIRATTNAKGQATIKISQNVGNYIVKVNYAGDDIEYGPSSAQAKVTVKKISTKIASSNYAMFIKKTDYFKVTLNDASGKVLSNQKITFKVNKKTYNTKTNSKGVAKIKLKLKKGTYKVTIIYKGTAKYSAVKKTNKIFVKKVLKTKVTAPKITTTPKTSTKYTVTLKDENGKILKKQKVTVNINGKKYTKKTNSKGQVTIKVKFSKIKSYKVKATYKGSKLYKKSSASGKISVQKFTTKITAPNMDAFPNTSKDYTVTLTGGGKPIAKQSLKIALNGQTYTKTTNNNGQVTIQTKFANENSYKVTVTYAGSTIYKSANAAGTIKVSRVQTQLVGYDRTFSKDSNDSYIITLKDSTGNALVNQKIIYNINNTDYSQFTDNMGQIKVNISSLTVGSYEFKASYQQSNQYKSSSSNSLITILNKTGITFIDKDLPGDEIQARLNQADINVEFLGNTYNDVSLTINKAFNITFMPNTIFNGKAKSVVLTVSVSNYRISDLTINPNEGEGIVILNSNNVTLENNTISNTLNQANLKKYNLGELLIPGNGIRLSNVSEVRILKNDIKSFGNAIIMENSNGIKINNNTLSLSNYGITYGEGVKNTNVSNNLITKNIGLYVMDVPEGPLGYGIYLYKSAVNVTVSHNNISDNYMGISVDSNYSTGIVITSNLICDNALEGIRFNAGYDLAENAVEPDVNDNAIYRNAKGPSMMILGELSANPDGIYHYGLYNDTKRLQLGTNWYGKNARVTWDYDNNVTGYGTMCPRIATTYISVKEIEVVSPGTYSISFYKNDEVDDKLPIFEMYATLNDNVEIRFNVVNGVGLFSFDDSSFDSESNEIKVSIGPLKDEKRTFEALLSKTLNAGEIPA